MCELTEVTYMPGDVVWVKLGSCWWPGEVADMDKLPEEISTNFRKKPLAVVKFFGEDSYEYVKTVDHIYHYNNRRKQEFIKKGMDLTRAKSKQGSTVMDKFPTDVITAESLTKGDINILSSEAFVPQERTHYKDLFGSPGKKKGNKKNGVGRPNNEVKFSSERKPTQSILGKVNSLIQIKQRITHPRFLKESDHEVRIRQQPVSPEKVAADAIKHAYQCQQCDFGTSRQNVFILHCKAHRENIIKASTPSSAKSSSASKTKRAPKSASATMTAVTKPTIAKSKTTPSTTPSAQERKSSPKTPKDPASVAARRKIFQTSKKGTKKGSTAAKETPSNVVSVQVKPSEVRERDLEKRNRILADWDDFEDQEAEEKEVKKVKLELGQRDIEIDKTKNERANLSGKSTLSAERATPKAEVAPASASLDPSSVYDLIDDAEEFVPPPRISEGKRLIGECPPVPTENADTKELDHEVASLLEETVVPELPQVPTLPLPKVKTTLHTTTDIPTKSDLEEGSEKVGEESEMDLSSHVEMSASKPEEVNGATKDNDIVMVSIAETVPSEVFTVPAQTLSTVTSPSSSRTNGLIASGNASTLEQSQEARDVGAEVVVDPNSETATYVLVTIDDSGSFQQFQTLEGMSNTTLLAYDNSQGEEGGTRTLYIDPSQLGTAGAGLENLFLAIDTSDGSGMMQLQPQQVSLQIPDGTGIATSDELTKSKQDILAVALANTQVLQPSPLEMVGQEAVVKVTNTAQNPVMTPRVAESQVSPASSKLIAPNHPTESIITLNDNMGGGIR